MDVLSWDFFGRLSAAVTVVAGLFGLVRVRRAAREWNEVLGAVRRARADQHWTRAEVEMLLGELRQALVATLPFVPSRWFR